MICDTYLHIMHPVRVFGLQALRRLLLGSTGIGGNDQGSTVTEVCNNGTLQAHGGGDPRGSVAYTGKDISFEVMKCMK